MTRRRDRRPAWTMALAALAGLAACGPAAERAEDDPRRFSVPVACEIGTDCIIHVYPDTDPGPLARDFMCRHLAYDGHDGIDIRTPSYVEMWRGVDVIAAAPGTVLGVRDGEPDRRVTSIDAAQRGGKQAGNGVTLDHGDGWRSQYAHLRQGSVTVQVGDRVERGQVLGQIGLSGATNFPHLEFRVFQGDTRMDPFTGRPANTDAPCGDLTGSLWTADALAQLGYIGTGVLKIGFAGGAIEAEAARRGAGVAGRVIAPQTPALVVWADGFGLEVGDQERYRISLRGQTVFDQTLDLQEDRLTWFRFAGRRMPDGGWPPGRYDGLYQLIRDGEVLAERRTWVAVQPQ